jgi:hypothetical protein
VTIPFGLDPVEVMGEATVVEVATEAVTYPLRVKAAFGQITKP